MQFFKKCVLGRFKLWISSYLMRINFSGIRNRKEEDGVF